MRFPISLISGRKSKCSRFFQIRPIPEANNCSWTWKEVLKQKLLKALHAIACFLATEFGSISKNPQTGCECVQGEPAHGLPTSGHPVGDQGGTKVQVGKRGKREEKAHLCTVFVAQSLLFRMQWSYVSLSRTHFENQSLLLKLGF